MHLLVIILQALMETPVSGANQGWVSISHTEYHNTTGLTDSMFTFPEKYSLIHGIWSAFSENVSLYLVFFFFEENWLV